jgi:SAM-dependent methyltransferase
MDAVNEAKQAQRRRWGATAPTWIEQAPWRERHTGALRERFLAQLQPGTRVLELACGSGELAAALCEQVGPAGSVLATDFTPQMVALTAARAEREGLGERLSAREMDAEALDVPDASFDVVICSFGLMFCPNTARAAAEAHRVLRPGGRFAASVWASNTHLAATPRALHRMAPILGFKPPATDQFGTGPLRLAKPGLAEEAVRAGGFKNLTCETIPVEFRFSDADDLWATISSSASLKVRSATRYSIAPSPPARRARLPSARGAAAVAVDGAP